MCFYYFNVYYSIYSEKYGSIFHRQRSLAVRVGVPFYEILKDQFRIFKIRCFMIVSLSMNSIKGLLIIFKPPDKSLHI